MENEKKMNRFIKFFMFQLLEQMKKKLKKYFFVVQNRLGYYPIVLQDSRNCIATEGFVLQQGARIVLQ